MKHTRLIILGITLAGLTLAAAQAPDAMPANMLERKQEMAAADEASIMGRMSAVSHRELTEVKATLTRLAGSNSQ